MKDILKMVYGNQKEVKLESQVIELAETTKVKEYIKKYKSIKNADRAYYSNKLNALADEAKKNIEKLGDIKDSAPRFLNLLKEIGADGDYKELSNLLMNVKEDFDVMVEVLNLVKRF